MLSKLNILGICCCRTVRKTPNCNVFVSGWSAKDLCIIHRHHAAKCAWNQLFYYLLLSNACATLAEITGVDSYVFIAVCYNLEAEGALPLLQLSISPIVDNDKGISGSPTTVLYCMGIDTRRMPLTCTLIVLSVNTV